MFARDGLAADAAILEGLLLKNQLPHVSVVHQQELHDFAEDSVLERLPLPRLFHPLQIPMQPLHYGQS